MRRITLVKLTAENDRGYSELMSQDITSLKIKEFALREKGFAPIPLLTDQTRGFTLGYLVDDKLHGVANFTLDTEKRNAQRE